ncbi:hypothetical protein NHX12_014868 [Muraenolepis orangiensis]|uniref:Uncharacterized protein n=1 Tax=Muraenolepis orangiensis TaxID=630683 RepID=A0A9Q0DB45_9TELE|nr:hypothetical protein NHX12_014868 [Muraenolepis orangiensis]
MGGAHHGCAVVEGIGVVVGVGVEVRREEGSHRVEEAWEAWVAADFAFDPVRRTDASQTKRRRGGRR